MWWGIRTRYHRTSNMYYSRNQSLARKQPGLNFHKRFLYNNVFQYHPMKAIAKVHEGQRQRKVLKKHEFGFPNHPHHDRNPYPSMVSFILYTLLILKKKRFIRTLIDNWSILGVIMNNLLYVLYYNSHEFFVLKSCPYIFILFMNID